MYTQPPKEYTIFSPFDKPPATLHTSKSSNTPFKYIRCLEKLPPLRMCMREPMLVLAMLASEKECCLTFQPQARMTLWWVTELYEVSNYQVVFHCKMLSKSWCTNMYTWLNECKHGCSKIGSRWTAPKDQCSLAIYVLKIVFLKKRSHNTFNLGLLGICRQDVANLYFKRPGDRYLFTCTLIIFIITLT